jgi:toxin FitB
MWLLDTVTLSEATKQRPDPRVMEWLYSQPSELLFASVLSLGEMRFGIERLPPGPKRDRLRSWLSVLMDTRFADRILPFQVAEALTWAEVRIHASRTLPVTDALIAATALSNGLTIVTRNERDFLALGVPVLNPWTGA